MFFDNCILELWEYSDSTDVNVYGEYDEQYTFVGEYSADLQVASPSEQLKDFGEVRTDTYKAYLRLDVPVTATMKVRVKGKSDTYVIIGSPIFNDHKVLQHIKLNLQKERIPTIF